MHNEICVFEKSLSIVYPGIRNTRIVSIRRLNVSPLTLQMFLYKAANGVVWWPWSPGIRWALVMCVCVCVCVCVRVHPCTRARTCMVKLMEGAWYQTSKRQTLRVFIKYCIADFLFFYRMFILPNNEFQYYYFTALLLLFFKKWLLVSQWHRLHLYGLILWISLLISVMTVLCGLWICRAIIGWLG